MGKIRQDWELTRNYVLGGISNWACKLSILNFNGVGDLQKYIAGMLEIFGKIG